MNFLLDLKVALTVSLLLLMINYHFNWFLFYFEAYQYLNTYYIKLSIETVFNINESNHSMIFIFYLAKLLIYKIESHVSKVI